MNINYAVFGGKVNKFLRKYQKKVKSESKIRKK